jgi:two-component system sensor histidine kinase KdpD
MAGEEGRPWAAVHVAVAGLENPEEAEQARVWLQEARELGAGTLWVEAPTVVAGLLRAARERAPASLLLGEPRHRRLWERMERGRARDQLRKGLGIPLRILPLDGGSAPGRSPLGFQGTLGALAAMAVILLLASIFAASLGVVAGFPALPAVFGLAVGFIAHRWGPRLSLAGILGSLAIYLTLFQRVHGDAEQGFRFLFFAGTLSAIHTVVDLVENLHRETRAGRRREAEAMLLTLLGRALARCTTREEVAEVLIARLGSLLRMPAWVLVPGAEGGPWTVLGPGEGGPSAPCLPAEEGFRRGDPLEPCSTPPWTWVPLGGGEGVLALRGGPVPQSSWGHLQAFAVQGALALERVRWVEAAQKARLENEAERMRSSLLGAVSHDLRTPLAAIQGAATSLLLPEGDLSESTRRDLLTMVREESERLARLLGNLLDLTRLESGAIRAQKEWQPLEEVVGSAIGRLERELGPCPVHAHLPLDLPPPVPLDGALAEQLLWNLLRNARRHAPQGPVLLEAWVEEGTLQLAVRDRGPGVPEAYRKRIFDKFFRMPGQQADGGAGLGLAICDAIATAHGGRIWVEDRAGGGASFRVSLPMDPPPPGLPPHPLPEPAA